MAILSRIQALFGVVVPQNWQIWGMRTYFTNGKVSIWMRWQQPDGWKHARGRGWVVLASVSGYRVGVGVALALLPTPWLAWIGQWAQGREGLGGCITIIGHHILFLHPHDCDRGSTFSTRRCKGLTWRGPMIPLWMVGSMQEIKKLVMQVAPGQVDPISAL